MKAVVSAAVLLAVAAADTCSLFEIADGTCGQSDLNCDYVKYAKAAEKGLQDGTCAAQGFAVKGDTVTKTYPVIGNIVITKYTKPSMEADTCSLYAIDGDTCGQSDLNCDYAKYAKAAEKGLKDGNCADQGFTVKGDTQTKTYPVIGDIVITKYTKPSLAVADTCSLFEITEAMCGQSDLNCDYVKYAKAAEKGLQDGTCAAQGFTVKGDTQTKTYPVIGDIVITKYTKPSLEADTCSLYAIDGDTCGQSDLNCDYVKYAKAAEKSLKDGTCAAQGFTVKGDTETKTYPVIGDIVITKYTKPALVVGDTCSLYEIADATCGQSDLNCDYVKYAKAAEKGLQDGTCAAQGFTVKGDTQTKTYPVIGDMVITKYTKPSLSVADTCSLYAIDGDTCGQSDLNCDYVKYAKAAEKSLKDGTCAAQGFTVKGDTETKSYPVIGDIVITKYTKPSLASSDTCSLYEIADATCGQSDLNCDYVKYAKAAEKGLQDGTCAAQGFTVKGDTQTKTYPVIGDIVITKYTKPSMAVADTCSLYAIDGDTCGQSDLNCNYVKYAKAAEKSLKDGTCATQGFSVKGDTETKTYPVIGDIVITKYTKPALAEAWV